MRRLTTGHAMIFASLATIFMVTLIFTQSYQAASYPQQYQRGNHTFGIISSMQNDESGQPAWIVAGHWTSTLAGNNTVNVNQTTANTTRAPFGGSPFDMQIEMVRIDGSAGHTHSITNFVVANVSQPDNMTKVFNGTSTASMEKGPVTDIPTTIRIIGDKVISIWIDPSRIESHYGNTPIYGLVMDIEKHRPGPIGDYGPQMRK
jgi:hypothetical protein